MFGRERQIYRVYAEDELLDDELGAPEDLSLGGYADDNGDTRLSEDPGRTAATPRRGLGPRASRAAAIAAIALLAMALSALAVHVLRSAAGGGARPLATAGAQAASGSRIGHRAPASEGSPAGGDASAGDGSAATEGSPGVGTAPPRNAAGVLRSTRRYAPIGGSAHAERRAAGSAIPAPTVVAVDERGPARGADAPERAAAADVAVSSPAVVQPAPAPEFGFERQTE
jgi:hypothetical protein